ncbi:lmo0954 family membrane protein [Radiobacillus deserti]|uniref:Flagellar basal body rod protein n=1 Tax=Radiobacillus deserti TaxID=2594883 RepID=A0A516KIW4_9BACI|nr:flagellar basal body rod protein [Radiobacillus deserti]QDP41338.1 flagellar basal body rod protein [Radiobacillus deserti]
MKTFLLAVLAIVAAILIVSNIGPMILLTISLLVSYYAIKKFVLTSSVTEKILWGFVILIGISLSLANIPAFIGVVAFVVLYYTYKKWKKDKDEKLFAKDEVLF